MYTISSITDVVTRLEWSVIPVDINKKPYFSWKQYQTERATLEQINQWQKQYNPSGWAVITGAISKLIILDGDGEAGKETFDSLGIDPHRRTGSGGLHGDFEYPGWYVPTLNSKSKKELGERWPGLDIRGDGGYAVFCGKNSEGTYEWLRTPGELDSLNTLPDNLRDFLGLLNPPQEKRTRAISDVALEKALAEARYGRDDACFRLAKQLHDNNYSQSEAESVCMEFARRAPTHNTKGKHEPFSEATARAKVISAYSYTKRDPWGSTTAYSPGQAPSSNGNGSKPPDPIQQSYNLTDLGNAERFATKYRDTVRWCEIWNTWLIFNGKCWEPDRAGRADQFAKIVVRSIYKEAAAEPDDEQRKRIAKHANASESNRSVRAMLDRAKSELPAIPAEFNKHLYLLNCNNGTLDLRTGELRDHSPYDLLTRCLKIDYNPHAVCPKWEEFIQGIFANDAALVQFMKEALGMSLCGDTSEQCIFICHGSGSNGKTTMLETVRIIMEDYGLAANIETFQVRKNQGIGNDVAELYGARLVTASENTMGSRLNEAFIKKLSGKEPLRARRLHENEFQFMPEFTIWFAVNHKPVVKDTSKGMWRRVHFIPFSVTIEGDKLDKHLGEKLLSESEGILTWLVQGHIDWHKRGHLEAPKTVVDATQAYRSEMDTIAGFLADQCELSGEVGATKLYQAYKTWCDDNGERYEKQTGFGTQLTERGYEKERTRTGIIYRGLSLISDNPEDSVNSVNSCEQLSNNFHVRVNTSQKTPNLGSHYSHYSQPSQEEIPPPPDRACLKCDARKWEWDTALETYICSNC